MGGVLLREGWDVEAGWPRAYREGYDAGLAGAPCRNPYLVRSSWGADQWDADQWAGGWNRGFGQRGREGRLVATEVTSRPSAYPPASEPPESQRAGLFPPARDDLADEAESVPCSHGPLKLPTLDVAWVGDHAVHVVHAVDEEDPR